MTPDLQGTADTFSALLLASVGLVLLIACANVATISAVRGARRDREVAVRRALGAGRRRLARHLLVETGMLCGLGGAGGVALAYLVVAYLRSLHPVLGTVAFSVDVSVGPRVLAFSLAATVVTMIAVGLVPALTASRPDLVSTIEGDRSRRTRPQGLLSGRNALVVGQVGASLVLLVGGGLLIRSIRAAADVDLGYDVGDFATLSVNLAPEGYEPQEAMRVFDQLAERIAARPVVQRVALVDLLPLVSGRRRSVAVSGYEPAEGEDMEFDFFSPARGFDRPGRHAEGGMKTASASPRRLWGRVSKGAMRSHRRPPSAERCTPRSSAAQISPERSPALSRGAIVSGDSGQPLRTRCQARPPSLR